MKTEVSKRRYDPERRSRIIEVALDVIVEHGVAGTTHRRVAHAAGVPLGSMTYHFAGIEEVLLEAFKLHTARISSLYEELLGGAKSKSQACKTVVELMCGGSWATPRNMLLTHELYALASRNDAVREVQEAWMHQSTMALERHFDALTARALDALIEGITIHNTASTNLISRNEAQRIVELLVPPTA